MTPKQEALRIIGNSFGDDLERAEKCFAGYSLEEMQNLHGFSGKTKQEVLDEYRRDRANRKAAYRWAERQPN